MERSRVIKIIFYAAAGVIGTVLFFRYGIGLILPFIIAFAVAALIQPPISWICRRTRVPRGIVSALLVLTVLAFIGGALIFSANRLMYELGELVDAFGESYDNISDRAGGFLEKLRRRLHLPDSFDGEYFAGLALDIVKNTLTGISSRLPTAAAAVISKLPDALFFTVVLILASVYISADFKKICSFIKLQLPEKAARFVSEIGVQLKKTGFRYLRAYCSLFMLTFSLLLIGLIIIDMKYAFIAALVIAFIDILPVFGAGTVLIPWGVLLLLSGDRYRGFGLLILYAAIAVARQIAEPRIIGKSLGLYPLVTVFSMYAGLKIFGFAGVILVPAAVMLIKNLNDSGTLHLWKSEDNGEKVTPHSSAYSKNTEKPQNIGADVDRNRRL